MRTPVRYLDRLNTLERKLLVLRVSIEPTDPEVAQILAGIEQRLGDVLMAVNRTGAQRERYLESARMPL